MTTLRDVLNHIIERAPEAENHARLALRYQNARNVAKAVMVALRDPAAQWTDEERLVLVDLLARAGVDQPRQRLINFRVSADELELLRKRAKQLGCTVSEYVRQKALSEDVA